MVDALRKGHLARACKISVKCSAYICEHHKALCDPISKEPEGNSPGQKEVDSTNLHVVTSTRVVLQTAQAQALGKNKRRCAYYLILAVISHSLPRALLHRWDYNLSERNG